MGTHGAGHLELGDCGARDGSEYRAWGVSVFCEPFGLVPRTVSMSSGPDPSASRLEFGHSYLHCVVLVLSSVPRVCPVHVW
ncbi:hypothetical protein HMI55_001061 [Coelomomyces lativittatus]|nr:hypothetical protein HMI55_001061 [Coelomomyces lativittatus]